MERQLQIFEPLLRSYELASRHLPVRDQIAGLFVPTVGPDYATARRKIFYVGRDTYGWDCMSLQDCVARNAIDDYIEDSTEFLLDQGYLHYNKNRAFSFWSAAIRLHLHLKGFDEYVPVSTALPDEFRTHLWDFGYGNLNAIELPATLQKQGLWDQIDPNQYLELKELSRPLDKLRWIIEAFQPDCIVVFCWQEHKEEYLDGLSYRITRPAILGHTCWDITLDNHPTRVIWTGHPGNMRFRGFSASKMAAELANYLQPGQF